MKKDIVSVTITRNSDQKPEGFQHVSTPEMLNKRFLVDKYSVGIVEARTSTGLAFIYAGGKPGLLAAMSNTIQIGHADLPDVIEALQEMLYLLNGG